MKQNTGWEPEHEWCLEEAVGWPCFTYIRSTLTRCYLFTTQQMESLGFSSLTCTVYWNRGGSCIFLQVFTFKDVGILSCRWIELKQTNKHSLIKTDNKHCTIFFRHKSPPPPRWIKIWTGVGVSTAKSQFLLLMSQIHVRPKDHHLGSFWTGSSLISVLKHIRFIGYLLKKRKILKLCNLNKKLQNC